MWASGNMGSVNVVGVLTELIGLCWTSKVVEVKVCSSLELGSSIQLCERASKVVEVNNCSSSELGSSCNPAVYYNAWAIAKALPV